VVVVAYPLSGKLTGAEKNDDSAWLPGTGRLGAPLVRDPRTRPGTGVGLPLAGPSPR
jgi:hypothetical protein